ncbi:MAG: AsmA family protein [Deltaproteobacteria bacterium]|nr:AsmA family protein [Deltaproteobacteria bacterium]
MKRIKKIGMIVGGTLFLLIATIVILPFVIDVNHFKDPIIQKVEENINGKVHLDRIGLKLFPFIGLRLEKLAVTNLPDSPFKDSPVVKLGELDFKIHLKSILKKKIIVTLLLNQPEIQFIKTAEGSNIDALIKKKETAPGPPVEAPPPEPKPTEEVKKAPPQLPAELIIEEISIKEGSLLFDDRVAQKPPLKVGGFRLRITNAVLTDTSKPIGIDLGMRLFDQEKENLAFQAEVAVDQVKKNATLKDGKLTVAGSPILMNLVVEDFEKEQKVDATLSAPAFAMNSVYSLVPDAKKSLPPGTKFEGSLTLDVSAKGTPKNIDLKTSLDLKQASIVYGPLFSKPAGSTLDASIAVNYTPEKVTIQTLAFHLLSAALTGDGSLGMTGTQEVAINLKTNPLNLKELIGLSPANKALNVDGSLQLGLSAAGPTKPKPDVAISGNLSSEKLSYEKFTLTSLTSSFSFANQVANLKELAFTLFEGRFSGTAVVDMKNPKQMGWDSTLKVEGMNIDMALTQVASLPDVLTGKGNVDVVLKGSGTKPEEIKKTVSGTIGLALNDGELKAVNLGPAIFSENLLSGMDKLGQISGGKFGQPGFVQNLQSTPYQHLAMNMTIQDGKIQISKFDLTHTENQIEMGGNMDLDLKLDLAGKYILSKPATEAWITNEKVRPYVTDSEGRFLIPFKISGELKSPTISPDFAYVNEMVAKAVSSAATDELKRRAAEEADKAKKVAEEKAKAAADRAKQEAAAAQSRAEEEAKKKAQEAAPKPADVGEKLKKLF